MIDVTDAVKSLVDHAVKTTQSNEALQFSQAACNVAHAANTLYAISCQVARDKYEQEGRSPGRTG